MGGDFSAILFWSEAGDSGVARLSQRTTARKTPAIAGVSRGNTIRGNTTRNSERKMAL